MNYSYLLKHTELFPDAIGITHKQFEFMYKKFVVALRKAESEKAHKTKRIREVGGGRKSVLQTDRQKLFFILFYYKVYPTFRLLQIVFELDKHNAHYWKTFLEPVLLSAIGYQLDLPIKRVDWRRKKYKQIYPSDPCSC